MHETGDHHAIERVLQSNDEVAQRNREHFDRAAVTVFNLMSAPGAGKTSLLETTVTTLQEEFRCVVLEGDMVGELDAERLRAKNIEAHQISTGRSCHLDAVMVARLLHDHSPLTGHDIMFIENVGNLVCPAEFPLGEHKRVVLLSVTEGDDKPIKYPVIFRNCDAVVFTKCDLLPHVNFDLEKAVRYVRNINPEIHTFTTTIRERMSLAPWIEWIRSATKAYAGVPWT